MTKDMIGAALDPQYHNMYTVTNAATKLLFKDGTFIIGSFIETPSSPALEKENKYLFIEYKNKHEYKNTRSEALLTTVEGNLLTAVEYPSFPGKG